MTESLLPPVLQELREAIRSKTPLSPLGPYFHTWRAAAKKFPYLTGCCDVNGDDDPSDDVMLERLAEIEGIVQKRLALAAPKPTERPDAILEVIRRQPGVQEFIVEPVGREAGPLVDAPPGARDMFACPACKRQYPTITEATECHSG